MRALAPIHHSLFLGTGTWDWQESITVSSSFIILRNLLFLHPLLRADLGQRLHLPSEVMVFLLEVLLTGEHLALAAQLLQRDFHAPPRPLRTAPAAGSPGGLQLFALGAELLLPLHQLLPEADCLPPVAASPLGQPGIPSCACFRASLCSAPAAPTSAASWWSWSCSLRLNALLSISRERRSGACSGRAHP